MLLGELLASKNLPIFNFFILKNNRHFKQSSILKSLCLIIKFKNKLKLICSCLLCKKIFGKRKNKEQKN
jgi:hypothetical protein